MSIERKGCLVTLAILFVLIIVPFIWHEAVKRYYDGLIYHETNEVPRKRVAIVFGAAVFRNGRLSTVLRDRMDTAIELYESGIVEEILVSGHQAADGYDEPSAMMAYAIERGVSSDDVLADYGGSRTYDTCYRAGRIFGVEESILITQEYHLPRAIFTCGRLGVKAIGVAADKRSYRAANWYEFREKAASLVALWDVIKKRQPAVMNLTPNFNH